MKRIPLLRIIVVATILLSVVRDARTQTVSYTGGTHTENFDSMGPTGTGTPLGWFVGYAARANLTSIGVSDGSAAPDGTAGWNFGSISGTDRALGTMASEIGSPAPNDSRYIEVRFRNNSGYPFTNITVRYDGEQWRTDTNLDTNTLVLQVSIDGDNFVNMGDAFNFTQRTFTPANTALDGNQPTNRAPGRGGSYTLASALPPAGTLFLRWFDANDPGHDPALAIDNFSFSVTPPCVAITCPPNQTIACSAQGGGAVVNYPPPSVGNTCGAATCVPVSGSVFPPGSTPVTCTAQDQHGNTASCSFIVTVATQATQVWNSGQSGPPGTPDTHYTLVALPFGGCSGPAQVLDPGSIPGVWEANGPNSRWIGANSDSDCQPGLYHYQRCFYLPCAKGASITGQWAADDIGYIYLNGQRLQKGFPLDDSVSQWRDDMDTTWRTPLVKALSLPIRPS